MDLFALAVKHVYLPRKVSKSLPYAQALPRRPLPVLGQAKNGQITLELADAVNAQCGKLRYQSDPVNGLIDLYNHPEHTQYLLETGDYSRSMNDCDDYQGFAQGLFIKAGVNKVNCGEWNAILPWYQQLTKARYNHVICWFKMGEWTGIIDTNSAANGKIFWFKGTEADVKHQVLETFRKIYPADYYELVPGKWMDYC